MEVVRAERRHLSAHQTVLTRVIAGADLLPMAFGMISDSEETLRSLLAEHIALLSRQLAYVGGRVEMAVRLRWQEEDTFQVFVERFPELRKRRDACFSGQREPGQMELLELGRTFESLLKRERDDKTQLALEHPRPGRGRGEGRRPVNERLLFDLNCLVAREHEAQFEAAVETLAGKLGDEFVLEFAGTISALQLR